VVRDHPTVPTKSTTYSGLRSKTATASYHIATMATGNAVWFKKQSFVMTGSVVRVLLRHHIVIITKSGCPSVHFELPDIDAVSAG
jgi:hypothetical protein